MLNRFLKSRYRLLRARYLQVLKICDFQRAKARLISTTQITQKEKDLLRKVSLRVHAADEMYKRGNAFHYLGVGLSANRVIDRALRSTGRQLAVNTILDLPCGYGRVVRFLRAAFPNSEITAAEIDSNALRFCGRSFSVRTVLSTKDLRDLSLAQHRFDLIWCGSLLTHVDETQAGSLLKFFYNHLSATGICVFTTCGNLSMDWIRSKKRTYGLSEAGQRRVLRDFEANGYGYADYPTQSGYGISIASHQRMLDLASQAGKWKQVMFMEHGWDNHQDVYAFEK